MTFTWDLLFWVVLAFLNIGLYYYYIFRRKRAQSRAYGQAADSDTDLVVGTHEDLSRAEYELSQKSSDDLFREFIEGFVLIDRLSTSMSYSEDVLIAIVQKFNERGIDSKYRFQPDAPLGFGSAITPLGQFGLYVREDQADQGRTLWNQMKSGF